MARQWRIQYPGALYHVLSRGNDHQDIFLSEKDKQLFLEIIGDFTTAQQNAWRHSARGDSAAELSDIELRFGDYKAITASVGNRKGQQGHDDILFVGKRWDHKRADRRLIWPDLFINQSTCT